NTSRPPYEKLLRETGSRDRFDSPESNDRAIMAQMLKYHDELDFDLISGQRVNEFYIPDKTMYWTGIERGSTAAASQLRAFKQATARRRSTGELPKLLPPAGHLRDAADAQLGNRINQSLAKSAELASNSTMPNDQLSMASAWAAILRSRVTVPRRAE